MTRRVGLTACVAHHDLPFLMNATVGRCFGGVACTASGRVSAQGAEERCETGLRYLVDGQRDENGVARGVMPLAGSG